MLTALVKSFTGIVLWARDHAVYLATIEEVKALSDTWLWSVVFLCQRRVIRGE